MLVSIITVAYNSERTIKDTIESVLAQTYKDIEYIIIDGNSSDSTVDICSSYQSRFDELGISFQIISEMDNGIYDAMNKGIRIASGTLIGMINSDDWYEPNAVECAVKSYEKNSYDIFYADVRIILSNGTTIIKHSRLDKIVTSRHWNHPTTFVTKSAYSELGLYDNNVFYADFDLLLRIRKVSKKISVENILLANFRVGGVSNDKDIHKCIMRLRDRYLCYRRNGYSRLYIVECIIVETAKYICN